MKIYYFTKIRDCRKKTTSCAPNYQHLVFVVPQLMSFTQIDILRNHPYLHVPSSKVVVRTMKHPQLSNAISTMNYTRLYYTLYYINMYSM